MRALLAILIVLLPVGAIGIVFAHSGGTDSSGGHVDSRTGIYHHHGPGGGGGGYGDPLDLSEMARAAMIAEARARYFAHVKARNEARKEAKTSALAKRVAGRKSRETLEVKYLFHHYKVNPFRINSFEDNDPTWQVMLESNQLAQLKKNEIVRIECVDDLKGWRTWIDATGKYSTVGRYNNSNEEMVELELLDGNVITVKLEKLSEFDRKHVEKIVEFDKTRAYQSDLYQK